MPQNWAFVDSQRLDTLHPRPATQKGVLFAAEITSATLAQEGLLHVPNDLRGPCRLAAAGAMATRATKPSLGRWLYHLAMVGVIPFLARFTNNDLCHTTLFQLLPLSGLFISRLLDVLDAPDGQKPPRHHSLALALTPAPPPWAGVRRVLLMVAS